VPVEIVELTHAVSRIYFLSVFSR